eukprot:CAMPEP_0169295500 /NCGR_PEP_ID=MMETSP1016-20121227/64540_1 /TAXON_ID=342587 /ORGANISM="Karlodinium micrum, Strain CCMP2283" /LENGTH=147 /DNA_ID=CAMNT_0009386629 /DNA_START=11 /DNA_END=451 /DNA_ORIENTATION=+
MLSNWHYLLTTLRLTPNATDALDEEWNAIYDTYKLGAPSAEIPLAVAETRPGLAAVMLQMVEGDIFEVYVPSSLAYKEQGRASILPDEMLIYRLELVELDPKKSDTKNKFKVRAGKCNAVTGQLCLPDELKYVDQYSGKTLQELRVL